MAGDWIKVEAATPDKPEVLAIADTLGISPAHAFGCLFMVWRWFDQHTTDGNAHSVSKKTIERLCGVTDFADAMEKVGWLCVTENGISLPGFDRHCGETAKKRALTAKRVQKHKEKSNAKGNAVSVSDSVTAALPREEKRREDTKKDKKKETGTDSGTGDETQSLAEPRRMNCSDKTNRAFFENIIETFKRHCPDLRQPIGLNDQRIAALKQRCSETYGKADPKTIEFWDKFFAYAAQSDFLMGREKDWRATFDWMIRPTNFIKILEGNYHRD